MSQTTASATGIAVEADWNRLYVDGERTPEDRGTIAVSNPATETVFAEVPRGTEADVNEAYEVAAEAQSDWAARPPSERAAVVSRAVEAMEEHREEIVQLLVTESGSTRVKANLEFETPTA